MELRGGGMLMLQLQSKQNTQVRVHLCSAKDADEQCPITMTAIDDKDDEAEGPVPAGVLSSHPHLRCMEFETCGHRFNARALLRHFIGNRLNCPLCRAGSDHPMEVGSGSLANEPWMQAMVSAREVRYEDMCLRVLIDAGGTLEWLVTPMVVVDQRRAIFRCSSIGLRTLRRVHSRLFAQALQFEVVGRTPGSEMAETLLLSDRISTHLLLNNPNQLRLEHDDGSWEQHTSITCVQGRHLTVQVAGVEPPHWDFRDIIFYLP